MAGKAIAPSRVIYQVLKSVQNAASVLSVDHSVGNGPPDCT